VATITTMADHNLETVVEDAQMPASRQQVTVEGITGACSYLNGRSYAVREGVSVWNPSARTAKIMGIAGSNCAGNNGQLTLEETGKAAIQGIQLADGSWTAGGGERLRWRDGYGWFNGKVLNAKRVETRLVERGPVRVELEVSYSYNRPARTFNEDRACATAGLGSAPCTIPGGEGYYKTRIRVDASQPSVLIEDDTDMDFSYNVEFYASVRPNQGRYRGHGADRVDWGREPDGRQYRSMHERPAMDALRDFEYSRSITAGYNTSDSTIQRMSAWSPWLRNAGWYWMLYNKEAGAEAPVVGVFAGRASRAVGMSDTGPGIYTIPGAGGQNQAGISFQTGRRGADATTSRTSRMSWGIFVGRKGADLGDPYQIQNINRQMNLHGGINLDKVRGYQAGYSWSGQSGLYMTAEAYRKVVDRVRNDYAYYQYLYNAEPTARPLLDVWRDGTGAKARAQAAEVIGFARDLVDRLANQGGIYDFQYHYWMGGLEMSRRAVYINDLLLNDQVPAGDKEKLKAAAAVFLGVLWDDDFVPLSTWAVSGLSLGTANMPAQQQEYRYLYALLLPGHPLVAGQVGIIQNGIVGNVSNEINAYGAHRASPHYTGASMGPLLSTLQQLQVGTGTDIFASEDRLGKFAESYMNLLTPNEVRFGGKRKLVSIGDGSTEGSELFGQMATGFARSKPELSQRLMGAWTSMGKPQSGFHGTTVVKIDDSLPAASPELGSATYPGSYSVLRHEYGTARETATWMVNGDFYSDHRHQDAGSVSIYALGAPLSVDWGSFYSPSASGAYAHSAVLPESVLGRNWDADSPPVGNQILSPWNNAVQETFLKFGRSSLVKASFQTGNGTKWTRTVQSIHANPDRPVIVINDEFAGADAGAAKVLSFNLMAQGEVRTPAGAVVPPLRLYEAYGTRKEMPSASQAMSLGAGWNRFGFTGQWLIDFDVYVRANAGDQALIGNWAHDWHPSTEQAEFLNANARAFRERQNILRVRGREGLLTCILPYRKSGEPGHAQVEEVAAGLRIRWANEEIIIGKEAYSYVTDQRTIITVVGITDTALHGISMGGGPMELILDGDRIEITMHGAAGARRIGMPEGQQPVILNCDGGPPKKVRLQRQGLDWVIMEDAVGPKLQQMRRSPARGGPPR